jgi:arylformamidase
MTAIWRGFSQAELDREYSPSSCIPDIMVELRRYTQMSVAARQALPNFRTLGFGPHQDEVLDFFPARKPNAPLHVFIHGGYWQELSKDESCFAAPNFVAHGAAFAAINYTLAPQASVAEIVRQCRAALAWLFGHAAELGVDPARITVSGSSAGGHLVAMVLATDWGGQFGLPGDLVKGGCAVSGIFDLEPISLTYVNAPLRLDVRTAREVSPLHRLPAAPVPLILSFGDNETAEFKRQTGEYAAAWIGRDYPLTFVPMRGFNHFDVILELNNPASALFRAVATQMGV